MPDFLQKPCHSRDRHPSKIARGLCHQASKPHLEWTHYESHHSTFFHQVENGRHAYNSHTARSNSVSGTHPVTRLPHQLLLQYTVSRLEVSVKTTDNSRYYQSND